MTTLTITEAKKNLGRWLKAAGNGEDVGIIAGKDIFALRRVAVHSEDYALQEYGVTPVEMDRFVNRLNEEEKKERRAGTIRRFTGNLDEDCGDRTQRKVSGARPEAAGRRAA